MGKIVEINELEKWVGDRLLFQWSSCFELCSGERLGLIGVNGAGKSTLLRVIAGLEEPEQGKVHLSGRAAYVAQEDDGLLGQGSGGEKTRRRFEAAVAEGAELLCADEPTSHLDVEGIRQVEQALAAYDGAVIVISHDRDLLDAVCTKIAEIEHGVIRVYPGSYSEYQRLKEAERTRQRVEYEQYVQERERLVKAAMDRANMAGSMKDKPKRMSYKEANLGKANARSRQARVSRAANVLLKRAEMLEKKAAPAAVARVQFDLSHHAEIRGRSVVKMTGAKVAVDKRILVEELHGWIRPRMRIALQGANGSGKTTLLKLIRRAYQGELIDGVQIAPACRMGWYDQELAHLTPESTVLAELRKHSSYSESFLRTLLAGLGFKREDVYKKISVLSGGEKVKVSLACLAASENNTLLLDEPTNYLDMAGRERLEEVLREYPGTIIFASHDRRFVRNLATHVLKINQGAVTFEPMEGSIVLAGSTASRIYEPYKGLHDSGRMVLELELTRLLSELSSAKSSEKLQLEAQYEEARRKLLNNGQTCDRISYD